MAFNKLVEAFLRDFGPYRHDSRSCRFTQRDCCIENPRKSAVFETLSPARLTPTTMAHSKSPQSLFFPILILKLTFSQLSWQKQVCASTTKLSFLASNKTQLWGKMCSSPFRCGTSYLMVGKQTEDAPGGFGQWLSILPSSAGCRHNQLPQSSLLSLPPCFPQVVSIPHYAAVTGDALCCAPVDVCE